jgi:hypothetical protein
VNRPEIAKALRELAEDPEALYAVRAGLEDMLVGMRDSRMFMGYGNRLPANGLVIREYDGSDSSVIRIGTREAVRHTLRLLADHLSSKES